MSYNSVAALRVDDGLYRRVIACAATEHIAQPEAFVASHIWEFVSQPGWSDAYAYAIATNVATPGASETVITDQMILSAVQLISAQ